MPTWRTCWPTPVCERGPGGLLTRSSGGSRDRLAGTSRLLHHEGMSSPQPSASELEPGQPLGRPAVAAFPAGKLAALLLIAALTACGPIGRSPPRSGSEIDVAMKRGASWTTFLLKPGRLQGSTGSLQIKKGEIYGFLDGRAVKIQVKSDELSGVAGGRVQIDIEEYDGKLEIAGTWNDDRVRIEVSPDSLNGTITGQTMGQCQFVLDKTSPEGVRSGTSICSGLPEPTLLEFPRAIENWLTRGEAVTVLLALLSSSPASSTDRSRSEFDIR